MISMYVYVSVFCCLLLNICSVFWGFFPVICINAYIDRYILDVEEFAYYKPLIINRVFICLFEQPSERQIDRG